MTHARNRPAIRVFVSVASCLFAGALRGQIVSADPQLADLPYMSGPNMIRSLHPVSDAADLLRKVYGMVITYEDPLWEWPGEMAAALGSSMVAPDTKGGWSPGWVNFTLPVATTPAADLPARLSQVLAAYDQQTSGPRFKVLTSKLGLHIVPLQVRDRDGRFAPARNPFDNPVLVPQQERTAHRHLKALESAMLAANDALKIVVSPLVVDLRGDSFNFMFAPTRADDRPFVWGTAIPNTTARDALIDLLDRSATTFYWDMKCMGTSSVRYNVCYVNVGPIEIAPAPDGAPANPGGKIERLANGKQMRVYDRCGGCEGGRALTHLEQQREKQQKEKQNKEPARPPAPN